MKTIKERFDTKFIPEPNSGCWLWTGATKNNGYGCLAESKTRVPVGSSIGGARNRVAGGALFAAHVSETTTDGGAALLRSLVLAALVLGGCTGKEPPPLENSFCVVYIRLPDPADAIHMKKRENKIAVLTNEESADRECRSGDMGPR